MTIDQRIAAARRIARDEYGQLAAAAHPDLDTTPPRWLDGERWANERSCAHGRWLWTECPDCPRLMFTLDRLTAALEGLDRKTMRDLMAGAGPIGHDMAHTLAGDVFDVALGIVKGGT